MVTQGDIILREELVNSHVDQWFGLIDICETSTDKNSSKIQLISMPNHGLD